MKVADKAQVNAAARQTRTTRKEAKRRTRERLLEAARRMLLTEGEEAISAIAVAREAGVANATFYEHFGNRDDLLRTLGEGLFATLREELKGPRRDALEAPTSEERIRRQFRVPLQVLVSNPRLYRLALRARHQPASALAESSRQLAGSTRRELVQELLDRGYPSETPIQKRRLEMIADVNIAAVEALALGHLSGRYPDIEEIVDILILVTRGTRQVRDMPDDPREAKD